MAKYTMHDYEKEMREEERQTLLQEALKAKLESESFGAEDNWREWQKQQEEQRFAELESYDDLHEVPWFEDDWFEDGWLEDDFTDLACDDDWSDEYDFYDSFGEGDCYHDLDFDCEDEDELYSEMYGTEVDPEMLRISRKAVARNRHLNTAKAKKRAEESAKILERRFQNLDASATPYEEYRAYARASNATKKAERVKKTA